LKPQTKLSWLWIVEELPSRLPEKPAHVARLSLHAREFDDGQDLTYFWSSSLPPARRSAARSRVGRRSSRTMAVRSGFADLGKWVSDERDIYADYKATSAARPGPSQRLAARRLLLPAPQRLVPLRRHADLAAMPPRSFE